MAARIVWVIVLSVLLAGCGSDSSDSDDGDHALQHYEDAKNDARAVEDQLQQDMERKRRAIDEDDG